MTSPRPQPDREPDRPEPERMLWWGSNETKTFHFCDDIGDKTVDLSSVTGGDCEVNSRRPGRYLVGAEIGRGGVGIVHDAWDLSLDREIAVKVLLDEHRQKPEVVRRFLVEAQITGRLQHPGIVAIHDTGFSPDGRPFFVMERISGETLQVLLKRRQNPTEDLALLLGIFSQVCQAVAYAHHKGVIHRDLKPANIMVGAFGVTKVMDWGLAKVLSEPAPPSDAIAPVGESEHSRLPDSAATASTTDGTVLGTVFGTPAYLPPEQARGEIDRVDRRTDVFGLGSILCELLTGKAPYTGSDGREILEKAVAVDLVDAIERLNSCSAALDLISLARWCLSPEQADRPPQAADVVEVLQAHLQSDQRRAEIDLVRFFDLTLDLFCIASTDGFFLRVNKNFPAVLGHSAETLTSRPFVEFVHPDDRELTTAECNRIALGAPCIQFVNRYRHADGHYLWFEWTAQAVPEERSIYAVARDVTQRVALDNIRRTEQRLAAEQLRTAAFHSAAGAALTRAVGLRESLQDFVDLTVAHLDVARADVWIANETVGILELVACCGSEPGRTAGDEHIRIGETRIGLAAEARQPFLTNAAARDPEIPRLDGPWPENLVSFAATPLMVGDQIVGVFAVHARFAISEIISETLHSVANFLALAIQRHSVGDRLQELRAAATV